MYPILSLALVVSLMGSADPLDLRSATMSLAGESSSARATDQQDGKVKIDADRIYYGSPNAWTRAGVIDGAAIMKATASWKELEKRSIKKGDPEYDLYKIRAEKEAKTAIEKIAKQQKPPYDLIGEIGSIVIKGGVVPNLTDEIVQELGS